MESVMSTTKRRALVITGFQPFGSHGYNPSWTAAEAMAAHLGLEARLLPVVYATAREFARAHLEAVHPRDVLFVHLGLAADRAKVNMERRARNVRGTDPDNRERAEGIMPREEQWLIEGAREELVTGLAVDRLVGSYEAVRGAGHPEVQCSEDCGRYVCNALLYHSLAACEAARAVGQSRSDAIFIHIPAMEASAAAELGGVLAKVLVRTGLWDWAFSK